MKEYKSSLLDMLDMQLDVLIKTETDKVYNNAERYSLDYNYVNTYQGIMECIENIQQNIYQIHEMIEIFKKIGQHNDDIVGQTVEMRGKAKMMTIDSLKMAALLNSFKKITEKYSDLMV